ncbi:MAG: hypothetical protein WCK35_23535 [Chloroflexota bacterium]
MPDKRGKIVGVKMHSLIPKRAPDSAQSECQFQSQDRLYAVSIKFFYLLFKISAEKIGLIFTVRQIKSEKRPAFA